MVSLHVQPHGYGQRYDRRQQIQLFELADALGEPDKSKVIVWQQSSLRDWGDGIDDASAAGLCHREGTWAINIPTTISQSVKLRLTQAGVRLGEF